MDLVAHYKQQFRWRDWARAMGALPDLSGQVVLDLGCGIGDQAELLVARGAKVRGFDSNGEMVAAARSRGLSDAEFAQADLRALPGIGAPVDGIWCSFAAAYFPRLGPVLSSWAGHLREGGWIALTEIDDFFGHTPLGRRAAERFEAYAYEALQADRYDFFMGRRLEEVLMGAGFTVEKAFSLPDSELSFDGRATPDVLAAWQTRLDGMRLFREFCGAEYAGVRDEFLACLAAPEHKSQARVQFVLARKGQAGEPVGMERTRPSAGATTNAPSDSNRQFTRISVKFLPASASSFRPEGPGAGVAARPSRLQGVLWHHGATGPESGFRGQKSNFLPINGVLRGKLKS